ncbi:hypothetical protein CPTPhageEI1_220 [Klebsiella phage EI]|nr:hypothetical protein CPTPhageEI1_220 [Klebsiella phage EI]
MKTIVVGKIISVTYEDEDGYSEDVTYYKNGRQVADDLIEKMKAKGLIDLTHWTFIG